MSSLVYFVPILLIVNIFSSASSSDFKPIFNQNVSVRQTRADDIRKYMNLSVDPCHDFYAYACGNWHKPNGRATKEYESTAGLLDASINNDLKRLLSEKSRIEDSGLVRKAKDFYKSCLNAESNGQQQQQFLSEFIKSNGGFPAVPGSNWRQHHHNYEWLDTVAQLRKNYGMDILIGVQVDINYDNVHENSIYLTEPSTLIPAVHCSTEGTKSIDISDKAYELIEQQVAENLKNWLALGINEAKRLAAEIVTFEFELCSGMKSMQHQQDTIALYLANYERKNLLQFTHQYNDKLNLNDYMSKSFGTPIYMPVYMVAPNYFPHLIKTVDEFNKTMMANYIMYRAISMLTFATDEQTSSSSRRSDSCLETLKRYFPKALGEQYARQYDSESARRDVELVYAKVQESFAGSLESAWIEDGTRRVGLRKLQDIKLNFIAAPAQRMQASNLQINTDNYWQNLATVMAERQAHEIERIFASSPPQPRDEIQAYETRIKYRAVHKRIDMGLGLLQPPYYHAEYGQALRYAAIGQKLAEQFAIAFDDIHSAVDLLERNSWDLLTAAEYRNRSKCFQTQIGNYLYNIPTAYANVTELRQLIASSAGLGISFNAYLKWLHFQSPNNDFSLLSKETLPELNYSNTQLFFINFAQLHCRTEERNLIGVPIYSARQEHSLTRYAVNGPLKNSIEFAREFGCKLGIAMNPADKCVIY